MLQIRPPIGTVFILLSCATVITSVCPSGCVCHNTIVTCKGPFSNVPSGIPNNVTKLSLKNTLITVLHKLDFKNLTHLDSLDISDNPNLNQIEPGAFTGLDKLSILTLNNNKLNKSTHETFVGAVNLKKLYLNKNQFSAVPALSFSKLSYLALIGNRITSVDIPPTFNCSHLTTLYLNQNFISKVNNTSFGALKYALVSSIYLSDNNITHIDPNSFVSVAPFLTSLNLNGNANLGLRDIQNALVGINGSVSHVALKNTGITKTVDGLFQNVKTLVNVELSDNKLTDGKLADGTFDGIQINNLAVSNCSIKSLNSRLFSSMKTSLARLYLQHNHFTELTNETFSSLTVLIYLNLASNKLSHWESGTFDHLTKTLETLDLTNNNITSLQEYGTNGIGSLLGKDSKLVSLRLMGNPFNCTCDSLNWFVGWIKGNPKAPHVIPDLDKLFCGGTQNKVVDFPFEKCANVTTTTTPYITTSISTDSPLTTISTVKPSSDFVTLVPAKAIGLSPLTKLILKIIGGLLSGLALLSILAISIVLLVKGVRRYQLNRSINSREDDQSLLWPGPNDSPSPGRSCLGCCPVVIPMSTLGSRATEPGTERNNTRPNDLPPEFISDDEENGYDEDNQYNIFQETEPRLQVAELEPAFSTIIVVNTTSDKAWTHLQIVAPLTARYPGIALRQISSEEEEQKALTPRSLFRSDSRVLLVVSRAIFEDINIRNLITQLELLDNSAPRLLLVIRRLPPLAKLQQWPNLELQLRDPHVLDWQDEAPNQNLNDRTARLAYALGLSSSINV